MTSDFRFDLESSFYLKTATKQHHYQNKIELFFKKHQKHHFNPETNTPPKETQKHTSIIICKPILKSNGKPTPIKMRFHFLSTFGKHDCKTTPSTNFIFLKIRFHFFNKNFKTSNNKNNKLSTIKKKIILFL